MGTVLRIDGFAVVIYPNDHLPAHVHVRRRGEGMVRIAIATGDVLSVHEMDAGNVSKAVRIVEAHTAYLLGEWEKIHGKD